MEAYTTLRGRVLALDDLSPEQQAYWERCKAAYHAGISWDEFSDLVSGDTNPLLRETRGRITDAVWHHPLFQAVRDMEDRLGILQGELEPGPGDDITTDPFADEWLSAPEAARRKGVSLAGLHQAIERGEVIARPLKPGGAWLRVSANSLSRWQPNPRRQAAGKSISAASH